MIELKKCSSLVSSKIVKDTYTFFSKTEEQGGDSVNAERKRNNNPYRLPEKFDEKFIHGSSRKEGLVNIGNSCYFNTGLQCVSATKELLTYFMFDGYEKDLKFSKEYSYLEGNLAQEYRKLLMDLY